MNDTPLRIGYVMQNGVPGSDTAAGPLLHVTAVINELGKLGHQVRTVANKNGNIVWSDDFKHWSPAECSARNHTPFRMLESPIRRIQSELQLPYVGLFDSLRFADACMEPLAGFDLIYERHGYMGFGGKIAAQRLGIPHILELNGNIVKEIDVMGVYMTPIQRALGRQITKYTFKATDRVVVVSDALKQELVSAFGIAEGDVSVVINGVNFELFERDYDELEVREEFGIDGKPVIVFVGSFEPWHGVDLLVEAFDQVQRQIPGCQLVLVGDGLKWAEIESQIKDLGLQSSVLLPGRLSQAQVAAVLSIADAVAAPYPFEHHDIVGTPLKLMEYLAAGKAIVASTAPIHEIVEDGVTGLRVAPGNSRALAEGLLRVLENRQLSESLQRNAAEDAAKYSWGRVVGQLVELFYAELDRGGRQASLPIVPSAVSHS